MEVAVKKCGRCEIEFTPSRSNQKYCGNKCSHAAWRGGSKGTAKARSNQYKHRYGITLEERDAKRTAQDFRCAICNRHEEEVGLLRVDHDHTTGTVREMLCHGCNTSLGHFKDDPEALLAAAAYLIAHQGGVTND